MITTILFDLDGTLLPMDEDTFTKDYFARISNKLEPLGFARQKTIEGILAGVKAMSKNDGNNSNEDMFWSAFSQCLGQDMLKYKSYFDDFYQNDFDKVQKTCGFNPLAKKTVDLCKEKGFVVALATNPIFPMIATQKRVKWAGFDVSDFKYISAFENSGFTKPNPKYYENFLSKINKKPSECLMVGNNVAEDGVCQCLGIDFFLITDYLINKNNQNIEKYKKGSFNELIEYLFG